jgi:hypothetical protein
MVAAARALCAKSPEPAAHPEPENAAEICEGAGAKQGVSFP